MEKSTSYEGMPPAERMNLFYEETNSIILPLLANHINTAVAKLVEARPPEEDEQAEMILVADTERRLIAFA